MKKTITETQLVIPALSVLALQEDLISTKMLKDGILNIIKAKKADLETVNGRTQRIIDSRIDNLISHRTLDGLAIHKKVDGKVYIKITHKGKTYLSKKLLELV